MQGEATAFWVIATSLETETAETVTVYGIACRTEQGETVQVEDISDCRETVEGLAALLQQEGASPLHLYDIVCDFVAEL